MTISRRESNSIQTKWAVVSTVREPAALVIAFACHHLAIGASKVFLYFDVPHDPVAKVAATIDGVEVVLCDTAYWAEAGFRKPPEPQTRRQNTNANHAMRKVGFDWLLHVDADEFLWCPGDFTEALLAVPDDAAWLHIPNIERCWIGPAGDRLFEGAFRAPLHDQPGLDAEIYGARANALSGGLGGHSAGKAVARRGIGFLAIHKVRSEEGGTALPKAEAAEARILHFDGITPRHWSLKNLRYAVQGIAMNKLLNRQRMATIGAILRAPDPEKASLRVHQALFRVSEQEAAALLAQGKLVCIDPQIEASVAKMAPHLSVDFSASAFDRIHAAELSARSQAIVRQKRRAKRHVQ